MKKIFFILLLSTPAFATNYNALDWNVKNTCTARDVSATNSVGIGIAPQVGQTLYVKGSAVFARDMDVLTNYFFQIGSNSESKYDISSSTDVGGMNLKPAILNTASITSNYGQTIKMASLADGSNHTLSNQIGLFIEGTHKGSTGAGVLTINNVYGALIDPQTLAANNNFGMRIFGPTGASSTANYGLFIDAPSGSSGVNEGIHNVGTMKQVGAATFDSDLFGTSGIFSTLIRDTNNYLNGGFEAGPGDGFYSNLYNFGAEKYRKTSTTAAFAVYPGASTVYFRTAPANPGADGAAASLTTAWSVDTGTNAITMPGSLTVTGTISAGGVSLRTVATVTGSSVIPTITKDYILNMNNSSSANATLPDAVASDSYCVNIKKINTGSVSVLTTGGQTIDGGASDSISVLYQAQKYCAINGQWFKY